MKKMSELVKENKMLKGALIIAIVALFIAAISQAVLINNKLGNEQGACLESAPTNSRHASGYDCHWWDGAVCVDNSSQYYGCNIVKEQCSTEFLS